LTVAWCVVSYDDLHIKESTSVPWGLFHVLNLYLLCRAFSL
jgi:hypothetical protein